MLSVYVTLYISLWLVSFMNAKQANMSVMQKEDERKLDGIKNKKCNGECWLYLKEDENRDQDRDREIKIDGELCKDEEEIKCTQKTIGSKWVKRGGAFSTKHYIYTHTKKALFFF